MTVVSSDVISANHKNGDGIWTHTTGFEHMNWVAHRIDVKPSCREVADCLACGVWWRQSKRCGRNTMSESRVMTNLIT